MRRPQGGHFDWSKFGSVDGLDWAKDTADKVVAHTTHTHANEATDDAQKSASKMSAVNPFRSSW